MKRLLIIFIIMALFGCNDPSTGGLNIASAVSISFTDTDLDGDEISGTVTIERALDESELTHYVLYWATGPGEKSGSPVAELAKTGSHITYTFTDEIIPEGITRLLVVTKQNSQEMETGVSVQISDLAGNCQITVINEGDNFNFAIGNSLTDFVLSPGEISMMVTWGPASLESGIYKIYAEPMIDDDTDYFRELLINGTDSAYHFKYGEQYSITYNSSAAQNECTLVIE